MTAHQVKLVELETVLTRVQLISHVYNLLHALFPITEQDVNARLDMRETGLHHAQKSEKENVNTMLIVLITELAYNINV
jgi:hypothetical protein